MNRRSTPGAVIYQDSGGMDFFREANGFQFARIHVQIKIYYLWRLDGDPSWQ